MITLAVPVTDPITGAGRPASSAAPTGRVGRTPVLCGMPTLASRTSLRQAVLAHAQSVEAALPAEAGRALSIHACPKAGCADLTFTNWVVLHGEVRGQAAGKLVIPRTLLQVILRADLTQSPMRIDWHGDGTGVAYRWYGPEQEGGPGVLVSGAVQLAVGRVAGQPMARPATKAECDAMPLLLPVVPMGPMPALARYARSVVHPTVAMAAAGAGAVGDAVAIWAHEIDAILAEL